MRFRVSIFSGRRLPIIRSANLLGVELRFWTLLLNGLDGCHRQCNRTRRPGDRFIGRGGPHRRPFSAGYFHLLAEIFAELNAFASLEFVGLFSVDTRQRVIFAEFSETTSHGNLSIA